jgi:hypothetical protein
MRAALNPSLPTAIGPPQQPAPPRLWRADLERASPAYWKELAFLIRIRVGA